MNYEKPNVALVASAVEAVKSQAKDDIMNPDQSGLYHTAAAYEADE